MTKVKTMSTGIIGDMNLYLAMVDIFFELIDKEHSERLNIYRGHKAMVKSTFNIALLFGLDSIGRSFYWDMSNLNLIMGSSWRS